MKKTLALAIVLMLFIFAGALAAEQTDSPGTPTQDAVLSITAFWDDAANTPADLQTRPTDQLVMDTVTDIFKFVYEEDNRPARYFPEDVQKQIAQMYEIDPDILYMTEFMGMHAPQAKPDSNLNCVMLMDVDYQPGQLVVPVLGDTTNPEALKWTPVEGRVTAVGQIEFIIPAELMTKLQNSDFLFSLMTVQKNARGGIVVRWEEIIHIETPSKAAKDLVRVHTERLDGDSDSDDFELIIVNETPVINKELKKLRTHVKDYGLSISSYLPADSQNEIQLLLNKNGKGTKKESLVLNEYLCLIQEGYKDTYGDIAAAFSFATPYTPGQDVVTVLGLPLTDVRDSDPTLMQWAVQRAKVKEDGCVEVVFDQLMMIGMGNDTGLLLVLSEPLEQ